MLERGSVVTPSYSADVQGWIGLLDGTLGLNGTMQARCSHYPCGCPRNRRDAAGRVPSAPQGIAFTIEGTLAAPVARPLTPTN